jgi:phosphoribosylformylglycinamidine synthase
VGGVGLLSDVGARVGSGFTEVGQSILVIGKTTGHLGASLYLREVAGSEDGAPPPVDLETEKRHGRTVLGLIQKGFVAACHDVSDGGLLVALAEMCLPRGIGAQVRFPTGLPAYAYAFAEDQARYVIAIAPEHKDTVITALNQLDIPFDDLGTTVPDLLIVEDILRAPIERLRDIHEAWLPGFMGD